MRITVAASISHTKQPGLLEVGDRGCIRTTIKCVEFSEIFDTRTQDDMIRVVLLRAPSLYSSAAVRVDIFSDRTPDIIRFWSLHYNQVKTLLFFGHIIMK